MEYYDAIYAAHKKYQAASSKTHFITLNEPLLLAIKLNK